MCTTCLSTTLTGQFQNRHSYLARNFDFPILQGGSLDDFTFRRYNPTQGRWISPDPAGLGAGDPGSPQTWNRYAYVGNTPTSRIDPSGLVDITPGMLYGMM